MPARKERFLNYRPTRRALLKGALVLGSYAIASKLFDRLPSPKPLSGPDIQGKLQMEPVTNSEKRAAPEIQSPYFNAALNKAELSGSPFIPQITEVLKAIDREGILNYGLFRPSSTEGLVVPYTKVSVASVINSVFKKETEQRIPKADQTQRVHLVLPGFAFFPAGYPFTAWDVVYDKVFKDLSRVASGSKPNTSEDTIIYIPGSPNGLTGQVTSEWRNKLFKNGFNAYAEYIAEFAGPIINDSSHTTLHGVSLGASIAEQTARYFPNLGSRLQVLADNPVGNHSSFSLPAKAFQVPLGFANEAVLKIKGNEAMETTGKDEKIFVEKLKEYFKSLGIDLGDSEEQLKLKNIGLGADALYMIKGWPFDTKNVRSYVRQGVEDTSSISPLFVLKVLQAKDNKGITAFQDGKSIVFPIKGGHLIDRIRIPHWDRAIARTQEILESD
jgi:hypothetical protein